MRKQSIIFITVVFIITALLLSSTAHAASTIEKTSPSAQDDLLEMLKQSLEEEVESSVSGLQEYQYHTDIWNEISKYYNSSTTMIRTANSVDDLGIIAGPFFVMNEDIAESIGTLDELIMYTKDTYNNSSDLPVLKKNLLSRLNSLDVYREDYTDYNWDLLITYKNDVKNSINSSSTVTKYIDSLEKYSWLEYITYFDESNEEDDDDDSLSTIFIGDTTVGNDSRIYNYLNYNDYTTPYNNSYLQVGINAGYEELLSLVKSNGLYDKYKSQLQDFQKNGVKKYESAAKILTTYENLKTKIQNDIKYTTFTTSDYYRYCQEVEKYFYTTYNKNNYSQKNYGKLQEAFTAFTNELRYCKTSTQAEVIKDSCYKKFKAVKTLKQELSALKIKYNNNLAKNYKNKKKYNQTKVNKLRKEAKNSFNKCTTISSLNKSYNTYVKKLNNTIYKFKVVTVKKGKGTISRSKTTAYGSTYILKLQPYPGHKLTSVKINGKKQKLRYMYKIKIYKNTKINVVFK